MLSTVTVRGQTAIPAIIRKRYNIKPKMHLEWIDDGHSITVFPVPQNPLKALKGLSKKGQLVKALLKFRREDKQRG